jgi:hypothetical protein
MSKFQMILCEELEVRQEQNRGTHVRPCGTNMGHPEQKLIQVRSETAATHWDEHGAPRAKANPRPWRNCGHPPFQIHSGKDAAL